MFHIFTIGDKEYKLKLSTQYTILLEKKLGCNPLMIFGINGDRIPTITEMVAILWASLQQLNHGISEADTYKLFDTWLEEGHIPTDFIKDIVEIYKASGLMREDSEKN